MRELFGPDQREDLLRRGYTRRHFGRLAALLTTGAALPFYNEAALAQNVFAKRQVSADTVQLGINEFPLGPCPEAAEAVNAVAARGNRYQFNETHAFTEAMADSEGLPRDHVMPFAGSSDPLHRAVLAFASPERSFVVGDPGYEAGATAARYIGARVVTVPLRKDGTHDAHAMARADPEAGVIYVCNPNNPTGGVTGKADLEYLVANKPKDAVLLLDEAYIHFSKSAESGVPMVAAGKDVIVLRTFSKLYGLAALRAGAALARPDLLEKLRVFSTFIMPATGMAAATASLKAKGLVGKRRALITEAREETAAWLDKKGFASFPSEANMLLVDVRRPGPQVTRAMMAHKVMIGRTWPAMPNRVRVSVGTPAEMAKFRAAFARVMNV
jgi:histidinol-phosphate aminotransferase